MEDLSEVIQAVKDDKVDKKSNDEDSDEFFPFLYGANGLQDRSYDGEFHKHYLDDYYDRII